MVFKRVFWENLLENPLKIPLYEIKSGIFYKFTNKIGILENHDPNFTESDDNILNIITNKKINI